MAAHLSGIGGNPIGTQSVSVLESDSISLLRHWLAIDFDPRSELLIFNLWTSCIMRDRYGWQDITVARTKCLDVFSSPSCLPIDKENIRGKGYDTSVAEVRV